MSSSALHFDTRAFETWSPTYTKMLELKAHLLLRQFEHKLGKTQMLHVGFTKF